MEGTIVAMEEVEVDTAEAEAIKDVVVEAEEDVVAIRTTVEVVAVAMEATKIEVTAVHLAKRRPVEHWWIIAFLCNILSDMTPMIHKYVREPSCLASRLTPSISKF